MHIRLEYLNIGKKVLKTYGSELLVIVSLMQ